MAKEGKKSGQTVLQAEVNTDDEWKDILERKGLTLVDIYSEWSGPCTAMVPTLRKIKLELGDILSYAVAKNDRIQDLERFRGRSEPTWMFIEDGMMVNLIFGANCPQLMRLIHNEVKRVQEGGAPPVMLLSVSQRGPEESIRFSREEKIRKSFLNKQQAKIEAEKRAIYEEYLHYMMCELSEENILIIYPWVFLDEAGYPKDKDKCPPYRELIYGLLPDRFDVLEQSRIQLNEDMVRRMFVESDVDVNDDLIEGLIENKILAMRLKARPPPFDWPVPYPFKCPDDTQKCPTRLLNDVENFLIFILEERPLKEEDDNGEQPLSYIERHKFIASMSEDGAEKDDDDDEEEEEEEEGKRKKIIYPAVWYPPHARSKVHAYKTLFPAYLEKSHPYEEPVKSLPLCAFKFDSSKMKIVSENYENYFDAIEKFGVFEFDDWRARRLASTPEHFIEKIKTRTGDEIFLFIIRRVDDDTFLAFAGNNPLEIEEDVEKVNEIIEFYFPEGAQDFNPDIVEIDAPSDEFFEVDEEAEGFEDENEDENQTNPTSAFIDYSAF